jgi:tetratricopeptide (TPR) repeat protein
MKNSSRRSAGAGAFAVLIVISGCRREPRQSELLSLAGIAPPTRAVSGRLSGFPYRPCSVTRGKSGEAEWRLYGETSRLAALAEQHPTPTNLHALAIAALLLGRIDEAAATFTKALTTDTDAAVVEKAIGQSQDVPLLIDVSCAFAARQPALALAAARRATTLQPADSAAAFNEALLLEQLQLRDDARAAWQRTLVLERDGAWAAEARSHLARLHEDARPTPQTAAGALRKHVEEELLGDWASALTSGKREEAQALEVRLVSEATDVAQATKERSLLDEIQRVRGHVALARLHTRYREAVRRYRNLDVVAAAAQLAPLADEFAAHDSPFAQLSRIHLAGCHFQQNRYQEALEIAHRAADETPDSSSSIKARALWISGLCQLALARPFEATQDYRHAAALIAATGDLESSAAIGTMLAEATQYLGEGEEAAALRRRALGDAYRAGAPARVQTVLADTAAAALRDGRMAEAQATTDALVRTARSIGDPQFLTEALAGQARVAARLHDVEGARRAIAAARAAAARISSLSVRQRMEAFVDAAALSIGENSDATDGGVAFFKRTGNSFGLSEALVERARARAKQEDLDAARNDLEKALDVMQREYAQATSDERRTAFLEGRQMVFDLLVDVLCRQGREVEALGYVELSHSDAPFRRARAGEAEIAARQLPSDEAVVDYFVTPSRLYAWVLRQGRTRLVRLTAAERDIGRTLELLHGDGDWNPPLRRIYAAVVAPLEAELGDARRIVFIPDKLLHGIPFAALIDGKGRHLLERVSVGALPSLRALRHETVTLPRIPSALLVGATEGDGQQTLAQTLEECSRIAAMYDHAVVLTTTQAKEGLLARASGADVIHIALHAVANPEHPSLSALLFGKSSALYARDIAHAHLSHRPLVFLSACRTAASTHQRAGVTNLASAFLRAGASSVVATLWPIDDERARTFATDFHRRLRAGDSRAEAFRNTQLSCIHSNDEQMRHPSVWGAYQLIGND